RHGKHVRRQLQLLVPSQIDDRPEAGAEQMGLSVLGQAMQAVCPKQRPPADRATIPRRVAADVADVVGAGERQVPSERGGRGVGSNRGRHDRAPNTAASAASAAGIAANVLWWRY